MGNFEPIQILLEPPDCKEVQYYIDTTQQLYFDKLFVENTVTCNTRDKIYNLTRNMQRQRKSYEIQHYVAGTIHYSMGDTLPSVATSLSMADNNDSMKDKGQLLLILSGTKSPKDTIFVGYK